MSTQSKVNWNEVKKALGKFNSKQAEQILLGLKHGLDISFYVRLDFDEHQMEQIRQALENNLTKEQVGIIADPNLKAWYMLELRNAFEKGITIKTLERLILPNINDFQPSQIFQIVDGLYKGLTVEQVESYTDSRLSATEMSYMKEKLLNERLLSPEVELKVKEMFKDLIETSKSGVFNEASDPLNYFKSKYSELDIQDYNAYLNKLEGYTQINVCDSCLGRPLILNPFFRSNETINKMLDDLSESLSLGDVWSRIDLEIYFEDKYSKEDIQKFISIVNEDSTFWDRIDTIPYTA